MLRTARIALAGLALTLVLASAAPTSLAAQDMATGTWSGSIIAPDGMEIPVEFEVAGEGEELAISLMIVEMGEEVAFEDITLADGQLSFTFFPGVLVTCALESQDEGEFSGECIGDDGQSGILTMVPPADG